MRRILVTGMSGTGKGKSADQRELILRHVAEVEPLLRRTCTHEFDATEPLASVVDQLAELGREPPAQMP